MKIHFESSEPRITRLKCEGKVTQHELLDNREQLERLLEETPFRDRVLLNLGKVSFMDTAGISWLLANHQKFAEHGKQIVFCNVPPIVLNMLNMLHADKVLHIAKDEAEGAEMLLEPDKGEASEDNHESA